MQLLVRVHFSSKCNTTRLQNEFSFSIKYFGVRLGKTGARLSKCNKAIDLYALYNTIL